jgi:hypothetical protein
MVALMTMITWLGDTLAGTTIQAHMLMVLPLPLRDMATEGIPAMEPPSCVTAYMLRSS